MTLSVHPKWNPRYLAYAKYLGIAPDDVWEHDGKNNSAYIRWINNAMATFKQAHPEAFTGIHATDNDLFDEWLGVL